MADALDLTWIYQHDAAVGQTLSIDKDDAHHLRVLRLNTGDEVIVFNGKGKAFLGRLTGSQKHPEVELVSLLEEATEPNTKVTLLVAPTKNISRFEWVVEKATELGVHRIVPIECMHSERHQLKVNRMRKILISAAKQSRALFAPTLDELTPLSVALDIEADVRWMAHCMQDEKERLNALSEMDGSILIAIGPEGDFSSEEWQLAQQKGFRSLSLGEKRLRTETAAITAVIAAILFRH